MAELLHAPPGPESPRQGHATKSTRGQTCEKSMANQKA